MGFAGKAASIFGPMLWGVVVWALDSTGTFKYRVAVTVLLGTVIVASFLFRGLTRKISEDPNINKSVDIKMVND